MNPAGKSFGYVSNSSYGFLKEEKINNEKNGVDIKHGEVNELHQYSDCIENTSHDHSSNEDLSDSVNYVMNKYNGISSKLNSSKESESIDRKINDAKTLEDDSSYSEVEDESHEEDVDELSSLFQKMEELTTANKAVKLSGFSAIPEGEGHFLNAVEQMKKASTEGAILIGEKHNDAKARSAVMIMLTETEENPVKKLFLELGDIVVTKNDDAIKISDHIRTLDRNSFAEDETWNAYKDVVSSLDQKHNNPITMVKLMERAIEVGAELHFIDNLPTREAIKDVDKRDDVSAAAFKTVSSSDEAGSVILIGGAHLKSMSNKCDIDKSQVFNLS